MRVTYNKTYSLDMVSQDDTKYQDILLPLSIQPGILVVPSSEYVFDNTSKTSAFIKRLNSEIKLLNINPRTHQVISAPDLYSKIGSNISELQSYIIDQAFKIDNDLFQFSHLGLESNAFLFTVDENNNILLLPDTLVVDLTSGSVYGSYDKPIFGIYNISRVPYTLKSTDNSLKDTFSGFKELQLIEQGGVVSTTVLGDEYLISLSKPAIIKVIGGLIKVDNVFYKENELFLYKGGELLFTQPGRKELSYDGGEFIGLDSLDFYVNVDFIENGFSDYERRFSQLWESMTGQVYRKAATTINSLYNQSSHRVNASIGIEVYFDDSTKSVKLFAPLTTDDDNSSSVNTIPYSTTPTDTVCSYIPGFLFTLKDVVTEDCQNIEIQMKDVNTNTISNYTYNTFTSAGTWVDRFTLFVNDYNQMTRDFGNIGISTVSLDMLTQELYVYTNKDNLPDQGYLQFTITLDVDHNLDLDLLPDEIYSVPTAKSFSFQVCHHDQIDPEVS